MKNNNDYQFIQKDIAKFLVREEFYTAFNHNDLNKEIKLFYAENKIYNFVLIANEKDINEEKIISLLNEMKSNTRIEGQLIVINLVATDQTNFDLETTSYGILAKVNGKNYRKELLKIFAQKVNENKQTHFQQADDENQFGNILGIKREVPEEIKSFLLKTKRNSLITTWMIGFCFILIPILFFITSMVLPISSYGQDTTALFFGGTNYALTILGHQWWRIFSYGMSMNSSNLLFGIVLIILSARIIWNLSKFSEVKVGRWKHTLSFVIAYAITGAFLTIMKFNIVSGGYVPIIGIALGIGAISTTGEEGMIAQFIKSKLIWPFAFVVLNALIASDWYSLLDFFIGMGASASILMLLKTKPSKWDITFIAPIAILIALILVPIIMYFINSHLPAPDSATLYTLALYSIYIKGESLSNFDSSNQLHLNYANMMMQRIGWTNYELIVRKINTSNIIKLIWLGY